MAPRWPPAMLLLVVVLLVAANALSPVTATDTDCIEEVVPCEGDIMTGDFVVVDHDVFWSSHQPPGIYFTVSTSPGGNTVYTLKRKTGEKFEFEAPRGGMYKFCFHDPYGATETVSYPYGATETVSFYIHDGHNIAEEGLEPEARKKRFKEWMAGYHRTYNEEVMKKRIEEWMAEYDRTYDSYV